MESWRKVWRDGIAPLLSREQLEACLEALVNDDPRLLQGATTTPPPLQCVFDWPVEAACLLGLCGVVEHGGFMEAKVCEAEEVFAKLCYECDQLLQEPAGVRWFLNWADETPRDEMRLAMIPEVKLALTRRELK